MTLSGVLRCELPAILLYVYYRAAWPNGRKIWVFSRLALIYLAAGSDRRSKTLGRFVGNT